MELADKHALESLKPREPMPAIPIAAGPNPNFEDSGTHTRWIKKADERRKPRDMRIT
jgi:hypothetical protein